MKVIIPAAGIGSRLRPHTYTTPKILLPVGGKPILGHILDQVIQWGGKRASIIVGHLGDQIDGYVKENYQIPIDLRHQDRQLGLGHAVLMGLDAGDEEVLIILGDTILDIDVTPVVKRKISALGVKEVEDPRKFGVVMMENNRAKKLIEKPQNPPTNLAIVGLYYIRNGELLRKAIQEIIDKKITVKGEYQITDALQLMIDWGEEFDVMKVDGWYDCGKPSTLIETNRYLLQRSGSIIKNTNKENSVLIPPVFIDSGVILSNSVIGPFVSISKGSKINNAVIKNSIIGCETTIQDLVLEDSLVGDRAEIHGHSERMNVGASAQIYKFD